MEVHLGFGSRLDLDYGRGGTPRRMRWPLPPFLFLVLVLLDGTLGAALQPGWGRFRLRLLCGLGLLLGGLALSVWGKRTFQRARTNVPTFGEPTRLVDHGPFAHTRNPMYLGFALALVGVSLVGGTVWGFTCPLLFLLVSARVYIPFEEQRMMQAFGESYVDYRRRVPRWLGRVRD